MKLEDFNIIVTGAASGLGRCFSLELIAAGANVMACDVNEDGLAELAEEGGEKLKTFKANVADEDQVKALIAATAEAFGSVNGLINNAGIFRDSLLVSKD